jgi:DNA-binding CsgD family transcriptional regulator
MCHLPGEGGFSVFAEAVLTPRELQVLWHVAQGSTYARTARCMGISVHTVDAYLRRIRGKLGVATRAEMIRLAVAPVIPPIPPVPPVDSVDSVDSVGDAPAERSR